MNLETNLLGYDDEDCGFEVFDEKDNRHVISIQWDGSIGQHATKDYPNKPENRTEEEQRIMSQVEARAKYAAQREFEDADILEPMWDIPHIERGIDALRKYPLEEFHREFRDFYDALQNPVPFARDPRERIQMDGVRAYKPFTITPDDEIATVHDVAISYETTDGTVRNVGTFHDLTSDLVVCILPAVEFADDFDYHDQFHRIVLGHLAAQVRDCYLHMGEAPPEHYRVEGIGKLDIHGDGVGDT